jgi:hypothetical protein
MIVGLGWARGKIFASIQILMSAELGLLLQAPGVGANIPATIHRSIKVLSEVLLQTAGFGLGGVVVLVGDDG